MSDPILPTLSNVLPNTITFNYIQFRTPTATFPLFDENSYFDVEIVGDSNLSGKFNGYCIDTDRPITSPGTLTALVYSSYEPLPSSLVGTGNIEKPQNLDLLNWIYNQQFVGKTLTDSSGNSLGTVTYGDIQRAIWTLIDDQVANDVNLGAFNTNRVNRIVALAQQLGEGFVPTFDYTTIFGVQVRGQVGVILVPDKNPNDGNPYDTQFVMIGVPLAKIGDFVYEDKNANGIQNTDDNGISGVTVNLLDKNNNIIASTTTGSNGEYSFTVVPGDYKVQFVQPNGYQVSPRQVGSNGSIDSDGLISDTISLKPGENKPTIDGGFYKFASIGDRVWEDKNANGIQEAGEAGINNVTVNLLDSNGNIIKTTTTVNGVYNFTDLTPGTYSVGFVAPNGYTFSGQDLGGNDATDSDANPTTGKTQTITVTSGEYNDTLDAGLVPLASLGNFVFEDKNANGIQEAGEAGIANATVNLLDAAGNFITSTTTDSNGLYSFSNLTPGNYKVQFVQPTNFNGVSPVDAGSNDAVDSDAGVNLTTGIINLSPGENDDTVDGGFYKTASLGDYVFVDANNNGIQDDSEAGLGGVTVELINPANGSVITSITTDAYGGYNFSGLTPGDYQVRFTAPSGYSFSTANQGGDDTKDSDANITTGLTQTVTLTSGEFNSTLDAGLVPLANLGNFVFEDKNANGIQDAGETGIANATVNLLDAAGNFITSTTTNGNGLYSFTNLRPGDYKVQFVQPTGFNGVSAANQGSDDSLDSDGLISDVVNLSPGENNTTVDSGFYKTASLGDFVFNDANNNGIQDTGEAGIDGVEVQLINPTNDSVIATTTTTNNGSYQFSGLIPGDYQVKFIAKAGYTFTKADQGANDAKDSDATPSTGLTQTVTLTSGEFNGTLDAGLVALASLGNFVFEDKNANGIQDEGEAGIANATVKLLNASGTVIKTTTTDADGLYSFTNLQSGDYKVQFVQPTGFNGVSPANVGGDDSVDSDGLVSDIVNLSPGENDTTVDSGFYKTASLGDFVFVDANNNGIQDAGEAGLGGVTVELINPADDSVITSTITDANGGYSFSGLTPGDYQVKFTAPTGYSFSTANQGGDDATDSDADNTGLTQTVTLTSGEFNGTLDAGLVALASLGNFVFEDKNANGIQDAGETGIVNATVNLLDAAGNFITSTTTNGNGLYSFTNLQPGDYKVQFVQPTGFNGVSPANVGTNDAVDSDGLVSDVVNLSPGENDTTVDSGFYKTASLGDRVWLDSNLNGIQDGNETGFSGLTVTLTGGGEDGIINGVGDTTVTTTTNGSGNYNFTNLTPGEQYQVTFDRPAGYNFTQKDVNGNSQDTVDSDADLTTGKSQIVTLSSGENNLTIDAGIFQSASDLSITKTDGLTTVTPGQQITYTIVAKNNGLVTATNAVVSDIMPSNLTNVTWTSVASGGATGNDLSGTGNINDTVTLTAGSTITYTVTGTVAPTTTSLGSAATFDLNGNNNTVTYGNTNTFTNNGITMTASAFSRVDGTNGAWETASLNRYTGGAGVIDRSEGNGDNNRHTVDNAGGRDNYVLFQFSESVVLDKAYLGYVVGDSDLSLWIGNFSSPLTTLSDSILNSFGFTEINNTTSSIARWADVNAGNYAGNTIVIAASTADTNDYFKIQTLNVNKVVQSTSSLINTATITAPTGFTDTNLGNNSATDTNTIGASTVKIGDRVWYDTNGNGIQDSGELGVSGVTVKLLNQAGAEISTTTTDTNGLYQFTANANSTYSVQFAQPTTGFNGFTTANIGNDAADSDVVNANGTTAQFSVGTTDNLTIDAGLIKNIVDLSITKTDGLTTVNPGQQITYTIVAANNGPMTATNALVSDIMPTNLTNVTWTSVASSGATGNDLTGTGNINDTVTLASGSSITYTVKGTVAANTTSLGSAATFDLNGNNNTVSYGNSNTFTNNGVTMTARAFSRVDGTNGAWETASLNRYTGGLGVIDRSEGNGDNNRHTVDNVGGRDNYVVFQFSESVVLDKAYLGYVVGDSDLSLWIGNFSSPLTTLSDSILNSFGFTEINNTTSSIARWADVNAGNYAGNTIVIAASTADTNDYFKIQTLNVNKVVQSTSSLINTATITAPTGFTDTNLGNNSATDTNTIGASTVKIGDRVWYDTNGNGIQDSGELGVSGVTVKLLNQAGAEISTTTTDTNGLYQFTANANSTYSVQFAQPTTGFNGFTTANIGNDAADSDVVNANGTTAQFSVGTTDNLTIDAGLIKNIVDLSITKTDGLTTVNPGQQITYTIVAANNGPMTATNALVSDIMPTNLTNVTWTSVASSGATGNDLTGTGNINDTVTLASGSSITYTVKGTVAANTTSLGSAATFDLNGNNNTVSYGNSNTFTNNGVTMTARAFSRVDGTNGAWETASLNRYTGGLGVIDRSEGNGDNNRHTVDNVGGRDNYVVFQFSESVVLDKAYLGYVVGDSDLSLWIGNFSSPLTTLSDSILNSFGYSEVNDTTLTTARWADVNAGNYAGNTIVIAASAADTTPEDYFKIQNLNVNKVVQSTSSLINTATITAPTGFTDTNLGNNSATDTDTISNTPALPSAPGVRTPGFWANCDWQTFWDGIQGNEPSQKTQSNFADSDLLFAPYTNSAQPGKVLDPVSGSYDIGLLIGDFNRNGKTDSGENTLFYTRAQALQMVDASAHPNGDKRFDLGRSLVAGWLNYLAGNPIDTANTTDKDARYYINEGINWLQAITPDENGDKKGDGAIRQMTGSTVNSPTVDTYWNLGITSASSLPSPYNTNINVLYPLDPGNSINTGLDDYNNGRGLADNVYYGGNP
ncbi:SdrD B-like domain-containing protein [Anabaena azotica]|uniref:SdrD B-like domain-containing protein n=1 Tax=Anabaena azotica TaxID=197653 RepID=UPI0039A56B14